MSASANRFRWSFLGPFLGSCLAGLVCLLAAGSARAASNPASCTNDIDCVATPTCGGDVCNYNAGQTCTAAGSAPKGQDGWCAQDSDCKCAAQGAKCVFVYCTFTKPSDAPGSGSAGKGGGSGGGSGSAGTSGSGGSSSSGTGGSGTGGSKGTDGGGTGPTGSSSGGGCSVAGPISSSWSIAFGAVGLLAALRRRRARRRG